MRHIVTDRNTTFDWKVGDLFEISIDNMDMFIVRSVPEEIQGQCNGCFGAHSDGTNDFCLFMPNLCGENKAIYKPACDVSSTMVALSVLEEREDD